MDYDTWISTDTRFEDEQFEKWVEANEPELEGLTDHEIDHAYENWLAEVPYLYDEDDYRDEDQYEGNW